MLSACMAWLPERHDGKYQHGAGTSRRVSNFNHPGFLWKHRRFRSEPVKFPHPQLETYPENRQPSGGSQSAPLDLSFRPDKDESRFEYILEPATAFNVNKDPKLIHDIVLHDPYGLQPGSPVDLPVMTLEADMPVLHSPATVQQIFDDLSDSPSQQNSNMESPKTAFASPASQAGPGLGPGPGPQYRITAPANLETRFGDRPRQRQISFDKEWQKIQKFRVGTWSLRSKIHELRKVLRAKQYERSLADDRYFQHVRMRGFGVTLTNQDISRQRNSITELLEDCQRARDEYGPLEDDCNLLEDQLGRDEFELTKLEEHFYSRQSDPETFRPEESGARLDSEVSSAYSDSDVGQDSHPLVSKFLSKLGDLDILRERLEYHFEEKYSLEEEKESRMRLGLDLAPDDQEWLDEYDIFERNLIKEIEKAEEEAEELKLHCLSQGLVDEAGNPTDFEKQERQTFIEDVDAGSEKSEFVKFPLLLPRPGSKEVQFYNSGPNAEELSNSASDHINQWLLHQLRSSALDVNLLARTFESKFGHIKGENWELDVLAFWYKDGSRKGASEYRVYSSGIVTQAPRRSQYSARSLPDTRDYYSFGLTISKSLLKSPLGSASGSVESTTKEESLLPGIPEVNLPHIV